MEESQPNLRRSMSEMDALVVNIELTLISIIQGVALYFLTDNSHRVLVDLQYLYWPYVVVGLLTILNFWSRSILHTFTLIRWPLEFGHNFMYISCTLFEAITFTQIDHPLHWYALQGVFSFLIWVLYQWDYRLIHLRQAESRGEASLKLLSFVEADQLLNIRFLMPATVAFCWIAFGSIYLWPVFFLERGFHVFFAIFQMFAALGYQAYGLKYYSRMSSLIADTRQEWA